MKFEQWWDAKTTPEFRQDMEAYYGLTKDKIEEFAKEAEIEESMDDVDVWIFSQPITSKEKTLEFFFNWRKDAAPAIFTKSLGQFQVTLPDWGASK
jgi:hypothetical protein